MTTFNTRLMRAGKRLAVAGSAVILTAGLLNATSASAQDLEAGTVDNAQLTWGFNGYSQVGVAGFGPWRQVDADGNATFAQGTVSSPAGQTAYAPAAFPATSMPAGGKTPNVVTWSDGTGEVKADGSFTLEWDGSYTLNPYPERFEAPDETIADPVLTVAPDGSGTFVADYTTSDGLNQAGDVVPGADLQDITILTFSKGALSLENGVVTLDPDYQGVEVAPAGSTAQTRNCSGVWGSWPKEFVEALPTEVTAHYYSTSCGGLGDNKPALPLQLTYDATPAKATPEVSVSKSTFNAKGEHTVTVTGKGFNNPAVKGTRPPLKDLNSGAYVVFGKFADEWKPSKGAPSTGRPVASQKWALYPENIGALGNAGADAVEIDPEDGSFTATLTISKDAADAKNPDAGNYGIYTFPGGGATEASYETYSPIKFTETPEPTTSEPTTSVPADSGSLSGSLEGGGIAGLGLLAIGGLLAGGLAFAFANGMIPAPAGFAPQQFFAQYVKPATSQVPVR